MGEFLDLTDGQRQLHMAEFAKLTGEIAELVKFNAQAPIWAAVSSGAIYSWLITQGNAVANVGAASLKAGYFVPFLITAALATLAKAQNEQIGHMGAYLTMLEKSLGHPSLGWERFFHPKRAAFGGALWWLWASLLGET
jgi:hypothetical protein